MRLVSCEIDTGSGKCFMLNKLLGWNQFLHGNKMEAVNKKNASIFVLVGYCTGVSNNNGQIGSSNILFYSRQAMISKFETPSHPSALSMPLIWAQIQQHTTSPHPSAVIPQPQRLLPLSARAISPVHLRTDGRVPPFPLNLNTLPIHSYPATPTVSSKTLPSLRLVSALLCKTAPAPRYARRLPTPQSFDFSYSPRNVPLNRGSDLFAARFGCFCGDSAEILGIFL